MTPWRSVNRYRLFGGICWLFSAWAALNFENEPGLLSQNATNLSNDKAAYRCDFRLNEYSESEDGRGRHQVMASAAQYFSLPRFSFYFGALPNSPNVCTMIIRPAYVHKASTNAETLWQHMGSENENCRLKQLNGFKMWKRLNTGSRNYEFLKERFEKDSLRECLYRSDRDVRRDWKKLEFYEAL